MLAMTQRVKEACAEGFIDVQKEYLAKNDLGSEES
jgi:hypothetical protein